MDENSESETNRQTVERYECQRTREVRQSPKVIHRLTKRERERGREKKREIVRERKRQRESVYERKRIFIVCITKRFLQMNS